MLARTVLIMLHVSFILGCGSKPADYSPRGLLFAGELITATNTSSGEFVQVLGVLKGHDGLSYLYPNIELSKFNSNGFRIVLLSNEKLIRIDPECDGSHVVIFGAVGAYLGLVALHDVSQILLLSETGQDSECSSWNDAGRDAG